MKRWMTWGLSSLFVVAFALSMALTMTQTAMATDIGDTCCFMRHCPGPGFQPNEMGSVGLWGCLHYRTSCDEYCDPAGEIEPYGPPNY